MKKLVFFLVFGIGTAFAADLTIHASDFNQQNPQKYKTIIMRGKKGTAIQATTNSEGVARLSIPNGDTYTIWCESFNGDFDCGFGNSWPVSNNASSGTIEIFYDDDRFELKGISFATGKADLLPGSQKALEPTVKGLHKYDTVKVEISGHTDNQGGLEYNDKLSQARAETVRDYLIDKGIAAGRITAVGYGYSRPRADNSSERGRAQNRRIEISIIP